MNNKVVAIAIGAVLTGLIVGVVIASSGGGDSKTTDVSAPELTVPGNSGTTGRRPEKKGTTGTTGRSGPATGTGSGGEGTGGAQAPQPSNQNSGGAQAPAAPKDTQQNDVPPPQGSPAQKFEKFCQQNPGAC
jgi:hypothetical protein